MKKPFTSRMLLAVLALLACWLVPSAAVRAPSVSAQGNASLNLVSQLVLDPPAQCRNVVPAGNYAYVRASGNELRVIHTVDLAHPVPMGTWHHVNVDLLPDLVVSGERAYVLGLVLGM